MAAVYDVLQASCFFLMGREMTLQTDLTFQNARKKAEAMPRKFKGTYWHEDYSIIDSAGLFNLRGNDLSLSTGGRIYRGQIVAGQCGFSIAEEDVVGFSGQIVEYVPNRCCEWEGFYFTCKALEGLPLGPVSRGPKGGLRHKHYVVAEIAGAAALKKAEEMELSIVPTAEGRKLVNLEVASIPGKKNEHRKAQLL